jgi:hypothetical protein
MHSPLQLNSKTVNKLTTEGTEHLSANDLSHALAAAAPGDAIVYARGSLAFSIEEAKKSKNHHELELVRQLAWDAQAQGRACLTQRRIGPKPAEGKCGDFEYLAVVRTPR